jgi:hypothetical protein
MHRLFRNNTEKIRSLNLKVWCPTDEEIGLVKADMLRLAECLIEDCGELKEGNEVLRRIRTMDKSDMPIKKKIAQGYIKELYYSTPDAVLSEIDLPIELIHKALGIKTALN